MDFAFSDDQELIGQTARDLLESRGGLASARRAVDADDPSDLALWREMAEMGWQGTAVPEDLGGAGYGPLELARLAEELGRVLAPTPFASSVYLAQSALLLSSDAEAQAEYLPALVAGERIGTAALWEPGGRSPRARVDASVVDGRLRGVKRPVPDGMDAALAVVAARDADGRTGLYVAALDGEGVSRRALPTLDPTRPHAEVVFDDAPCRALPVDGGDPIAQLLDRAVVFTAFEQIGGAQRVLEIVCDYARDRYQFGRPIGSFQAVKHRLADMYVQLELARSNCYYGGWALATGAPDLEAAAATARISASEAFVLVAQEALHLHGGIGFTWEADPQLFVKRARTHDLLLGDATQWRERLVQLLEVA